LYGQARKALKANAKREHNALEWAIGAVEKSTERNVRRSRVNRVADSLDFLSQGSLDFRPDFHERDLGRAAIRKMEIGVSATGGSVCCGVHWVGAPLARRAHR
jgi:hypothetical protein